MRLNSGVGLRSAMSQLLLSSCLAALIVGPLQSGYELKASTVVGWGRDIYGEIDVPSGLTNAVALATGIGSHALALKPDGTVTAWGYNAYGQATVPTGLANVKSLAIGAFHSLALKTDGTVLAWPATSGLDYGQTRVPQGLTNVTAIGGGYYHSLAVKADSTVVAWGRDAEGQCDVPARLSNVVSVAGGVYFSVALKADGTVVAWGVNNTPYNYGQTNVPLGLSNVVAVATGYHHCLALKQDGTVVAWGDNSGGQCNVPANLTNVIAVGCGGLQSLAVGADHTVVAWGLNQSGQINVPAGLKGVVQVTGGDSHSLALVSPFRPGNIPAGLVGWWKFNGDGRDSSASGYDLSNVGTPSYVAGDPWATGETVGSQSGGNYWSLASQNCPGLALTNTAFTIVAWVKIDSWSLNNVILGKWLPGASTAGYLLAALKAQNDVKAYLNLQIQGIDVQSTLGVLSLGTWQHVVGVYDKAQGVAKAYVDGSLAVSKSQSTDAGDNSSPFAIGLNTVGPSLPLAGEIKDAAVWNRALTLAEVQSLASSSDMRAGLPTISVQPVNQTVITRTSATFGVTATGTGSLSYQWRKNGRPISGATSTNLTLNSVGNADAGIYTVDVSNLAGTVTSAGAVLTVDEPPSISANPTSETVVARGNVTFAVGADGTAPLNYQWLLNGSPLAGATSATLTLMNVQPTQAGSYSVVVTNAVGSVTSAIASLAVTVPPLNACAPGQATFTTKLAEPSPTIGASFGESVALSGSTMIVGTPFVNGGLYGTNIPRAEILVQQGTAWVEQAVLVETNIVYPASLGYSYGWSVGIDGDTAIVGASSDAYLGYATGSAWVYVRQGTNWFRQAELTAGEFAGPNQGFGFSVAVQGNIAAVGASRGGGTNNNAVYIFQRSGTNWSRVQILASSEPSSSNGFGGSVALSGNLLAVGAYHVTVNSLADAGAVYVFLNNGTSWVQTAKLISPNPQAGTHLGLTTLLSSNALFIADISNDAVLIYPRTGDMLVSTPLRVVGEQSGEDFGVGMGVADNILAVGAENFGGPGTVYLYQNLGTNWIEVNQLFAPDGVAGDRFGYSVAFAGSTLLSSSWFATINSAASAGAVYAYNVCNGTPPTITVAPSAQTVVAGGNVTLSVVANGTAPLAYQWLFNGSPVANTTSTSLTLANVQASQAGSYSVVVGNALGSVTSSPSTLAVIVPPLNACAPGQATFTTKLAEPYPALGTDFGYSLAVSQGTLIVGAPVEYGGDYRTNLPRAEMFVQLGSTWALQAVLEETNISYPPFPGPGTFDVHRYKYGYSVAIDGDTAIVGASGDASLGPETGSAWVYVRQGTNWVKQAKLTAGEYAGPNQGFGFAVAIQGDLAAVSASLGGGTNNNAVYVFQRSGSNWTPVQILTGSDPSPSHNYGGSLAIDGNMLVVGAYNADAGAVANAGAVYVFVNNGTGWVQTTKVTSPAPQTGAYFGEITLLNASALCVSDFSSQAVWIYPRNGNTLGLTPGKVVGGQPGEGFGSGLAVANNILAVGAIYFGGAASSHQGAVYLFQYLGTNWVQVNQVLAPDAASGDQFGYSVAFAGSTLLSGARFAAVNSAAYAGAVYAYNVCNGVPPTILAGPTSQTVNADTSVTFSVVASGTAPLTYQWIYNGAPLSGQTAAALSLNSVLVSQAGQYSVAVADAVGSVTTTPAVLKVNPLVLTVGGITAANKGYDGTTVATINASGGILNGVMAADVGKVTLVISGAAGTFSDKNVGTGKSVTISGLSLSGSAAGNYTLTPATATASITPATLTVNGITVANKVYDGTTGATPNTANVSLVGVMPGDAGNVTLVTSGASGAFGDKNVGTGKTVTISGLSLSGSAAGNYTLAQPATTANITARGLTVSGIGANGKVYDGGTAATLNTGSAALVGVVGGDTVTLNTSGSVGTFASPGVGTGITVAISGLTIAGASAGNYTLSQPTTTANITAKGLAVSGITANNKVYDGGTVATLNTGSAVLVGVVSGDTVTLNTSGAVGTFAGPGVGTGITVAISGLSLGGASAGNYTLSPPVTAANITSKGLTVSGITANNKPYDGGTAATLNTGSAALAGVASGDSVTLNTSGATGTFASAGVGTGITVTISGLSIGGSAANYTLTQPAATANITARGLTVSGITANSKVYDGGTATTLNTGSAALVGVVSGDTVTLNSSGATGTFVDKNVGTGKSVTISGLSLSGNAAANYTLVPPTSTATISPAPLTVSGITGVNKVFDGSTSATINVAGALLNGVLAVDIGNVTLVTVGSTGVFTDKNVGTGKTVSISGLTLTGSAASNYALIQPSTTANITAATATVALNVATLTATYDGTPKAATATTTPAGLTVVVTYNGSSTVPTRAGNYSVLATVSDINHSGSASGTLTISQALVSVTTAVRSSREANTQISCGHWGFSRFGGAHDSDSKCAFLAA